MSYYQRDIPKALSFKILYDYSDEQLLSMHKYYKQLLVQARRAGEDYRQLEEDVCYLQAELQNRDLPDTV